MMISTCPFHCFIAMNEKCNDLTSIDRATIVSNAPSCAQRYNEQNWVQTSNSGKNFICRKNMFHLHTFELES